MKKDKFSTIRKKIAELPETKREIASNLLDKAVFMDSELLKLQDILKIKGWIEEYQNGANQKGLKKSSEGEVYNVMIKNYVSVMKQINDLLPDKTDSADELLGFIAR